MRQHYFQVRDLLQSVLRDPAVVSDLSSGDLDLLLRVARRARLLGTLALDLQARGLFDSLPQVARDHLQSALVLAESRAKLAKWELDRIAWALRDHDEIQPVAMKGCAYLLLKTPNARGRIFADVDLMLPEAQLEDVERHLNRFGWRSEELSPYDQNYYRNWTHELPPLMHVEREVEIDLHHNVLPRTARLKPQAAELLKTAKPVANSRYSVLSNEDIVLHSMTHLMFADDLADKLRDLVDIDQLMRLFAGEDKVFWDRLLHRAKALDLRRPAFYALRYARSLLASPIPDVTIAASKSFAPPASIVWIMDRLVPRALFPLHPDHPSRVTAFCRLMLYVRSHWIRMPPWLLAYHLSYKFYLTRIRRVSKTPADTAAG